MEAIAEVQQINERPVFDRGLKKKDFTMGDEVAIKFNNRNYTGVVDFFFDEETVSKCVDSLQVDTDIPSSNSGKAAEALSPGECTSAVAVGPNLTSASSSAVVNAAPVK